MNNKLLKHSFLIAHSFVVTFFLNGCVSIGSFNINNDLRATETVHITDTLHLNTRVTKKVEVKGLDSLGIIKISFLLFSENGFKTFVADTVFDNIELGNYYEGKWVRKMDYDVEN